MFTACLQKIKGDKEEETKKDHERQQWIDPYASDVLEVINKFHRCLVCQFFNFRARSYFNVFSEFLEISDQGHDLFIGQRAYAIFFKSGSNSGCLLFHVGCSDLIISFW